MNRSQMASTICRRQADDFSEMTAATRLIQFCINHLVWIDVHLVIPITILVWISDYIPTNLY